MTAGTDAPTPGAARPDDRGTVRSTAVVRLVAGREVKERLRAKSFWILTALLVVGILAIGVIARIGSGDGPDAIEVGFGASAPDEMASALPAVGEAVDRDVEVVRLDDEAARRAVEDDEVDVAVVGSPPEALFADDVDQTTLTLLQQAWAGVETRRDLVDAGLDEDRVADALAADPLPATTLDGSGGEASGIVILAGTLTAILLFISLQMFGGYVLTGVVEEKSTAVVELLLVRVRADQLLAGKVLGIGVAAMLQLTFAVAAGLAALVISGTDVPGELWSSVPMTLVWFLLGYALYSTLFALAGSLVSRQEDAQAASAPILTVLMIAYAIVFFFGYVPESTASRVLSLLPPIAPLLMPMRMAAGAASVVEVVVALVLLVLATLAAWRLAGRIYEQVLLQRGSRITWKRALASARAG